MREVASTPRIRKVSKVERLACALGAYERDPSTRHALEVCAAVDASENVALQADAFRELARCVVLTPEDIAEATLGAVLRGPRRCGVRAERKAGAA